MTVLRTGAREISLAAYVTGRADFGGAAYGYSDGPCGGHAGFGPARPFLVTNYKPQTVT